MVLRTIQYTNDGEINIDRLSLLVSGRDGPLRPAYEVADRFVGEEHSLCSEFVLFCPVQVGWVYVKVDGYGSES